MALIDTWRQRARQIKRDTLALYLAYRDPRTPWYARVWAAVVVGYALSPIDLIPDFIPVLGYLDDLILLPLGIVIAVKLIPPIVMAECRARADEMADRPTNRFAVVLIVGVWLLLAGFVMWKVLDLLGVI